ncbi:hypothetical protein [Sorangium cellulosum]|uniref:hypothetical protein n=1 Tax=Sorangium cellulosum TaxID=56 RepID=UPI001F3A36A3|nr:hypothetical protein [Sorangium cellulosum]
MVQILPHHGIRNKHRGRGKGTQDKPIRTASTYHTMRNERQCAHRKKDSFRNVIDRASTALRCAESQDWRAFRRRTDPALSTGRTRVLVRRQFFDQPTKRGRIELLVIGNEGLEQSGQER